MINKLLQKIGALTCNISLLLNSFLPYVAAIPAYAVDSAPIAYNNSSHQLYFSFDTANYTAYQLFYKTDTKIDSVSGSKLPEYLYLGTCSDGTCLPQSFQSAILKIKTNSGFYFYYFTLKNGQLQIVSDGNSAQLDLSDDELNLLEGITRAPTSAPTPEITVTPTSVPKVEQICLENNQVITDSTLSDWNRDDSAALSETKEKVRLGVKYNFPQENKVSVTFKCLPKDESLRTALKIQQIKASELKLPDNTNVSEYAYDITTGMTDGTFEYDVTLPKASDKIAEVSYIEKTIDQAKTNVTAAEIKSIDNLEQQIDTVTATGVNHFTIFIIKTYKEFNGNLVEEENFYKGDTVHVTATGIDLTSTKIRIKNPDGQIKQECDETLLLQSKCQYTIPDNAKLGTWSVDLGHRILAWWYWENNADTFIVNANFCGDGIISGNETCDGTNLGSYPASDFRCNRCSLELIDPDIDICHSTSSDSNPYISNSPNKSGDLNGHASDVGPVWYPGITVRWGDIIPPFVYIGGTFPGLNWTTEGQAIYRNGCKIGTTLKIIKTVNNTGGGSKEATDFEFSLNNGPYTNFGIGGSNEFSLNIGDTYTITENPNSDYSVVYNNCSGTLSSSSTTCTITNTYIPVCGDGIKYGQEECDDGNRVNTDDCTNDCRLARCGDGFLQAGEECEGAIGVTPGQNFCASKTCKLIPIYDGSDVCPRGTVKSATPIITKSISSTDADGETFSLTPGKNYLFEASGIFVPTMAAGFLSDAGYTLINGSLSSQYGLIGSGNDYAAHALLSDFGSGTVGVINWGSYNSSHTYSKYLSFPDSSSAIQFVIGDRYGDWFDTQYQNQAGMNDNSGSLTLNVYECKSSGSITFIKDANPDSSQSFHFAYGSNDYPIGDFDLVDDNNGDNSETVTFNSIPTGTYSWTESAYSNWSLTAIRCSDDNSTWDLNTKTINVNLEPGEDVTCTITNTKQAKLTVIKQVDTDNDGVVDNANATDWKWDIASGEQNIATGQSRILGAGTYVITEDQKNDYQLKEWTCTNETRGATNSISVALNPGDDITCTITNTRKTGSIRVCKVILDASGNIVDGSALPVSTFSISGLNQSTSQGAPAGVLGVTNFVTPLSYATKLFGSSVNNALCTTYPNLIPGNYYYGEESISNNFWAAPKYNDGASVPRSINDNFYEYSGQLFDDNSGNDGSRQTASDGHIVLAAGQQNRTLIILNQYKFGNINITKFNDYDGDGFQDDGEENLPGWTINLTGQTSVATDSNGLAAFNKINSGDYVLSETIQAGWIQTNITCDRDEIIDNDNSHQISLTAGQTINCKIGNRQLGNVTVYKFNDLNGNGTKDEGENNLSGWTINLTGQTSVNTNEGGQANFSNLVPGNYDLSENLDSQPGWTQTNIYCDDNNGPGVKITKDGEAYGHHGACEGWNGCTNAATCALWACEINGYDNLVSYGADKPCTEFNDCNLFYNRTSVDMNWRIHCGVRGVTDIVCSNGSDSGESRDRAYVSGSQVTVSPGQNKTCYIGNQRLPPRALISKWNNANSSGQASGSSVEYKIKIKILDNNVSNFKVTDLLSNGFIYRPGTYSVVSSRLGDITASIGEPQYHSPGVWDLEDLQAGDELELSYLADISSDQQPGTYGDLAYALGDAAYDDSVDVLATSEPIGYIDENFSGTEVIVTKSTQNTVSAGVEREEVRQEGQVLGASTELPSTGSSTSWLIISTLMSLLGFALIKKSKKILIILLFAAFFIFPNNAEATSNLSLRVEQPKTPTNLNDVNLNFVALDILSRPVTVKCYKKYSTDVDFTQFGSDISLTAGGNANHCSLSSILTTEGSYQLKVVAFAGADSTESILSLDYKTSGPSTPIDYRKEHPNNCDYTIHFKTADDGGKTAKVEVYRSDSTSFNLDSGSFVTAVNIGSNQEHDLTNSVPDCSKNYYYVLRAFDNAGNGSGTTGDSVVKIVISTTTTTSNSSTTSQGAIPVTNATIVPETSGTDTITAVPTLSPEEGSVLGTQNQVPTFIQKYWLPLVLVLFAGIAIIRYVLSKRKSSR